MELSSLLTAEILDFYTDAAKEVSLGSGGVFKNKWYFLQQENGLISTEDPNIELYAICVAVFMWVDELKNRRLTLFCDNQSIVTMVNNTTSKCKKCMVLISMLILKSLQINSRIFCHSIHGLTNIRSDLLSRQKIERYKRE